MRPDFTDIHSHIIPGVDDGSESMEASLGLLDMAYEDGIRRIIATPHSGIINPMYNRELAEYRLAELRHRIADRYPDMQLYMGNELFLAPGYPDGLEDGMSQTLAGSEYVLVEFPMDIDYEYVYQSCRRLMLQGYIPILAHVERYLHTYIDIEDIETLVRQGVRIQINSKTLAGSSTAAGAGIESTSVGNRSKRNNNSNNNSKGGIFASLLGSSTRMDKRQRFAERLLKEGLVHHIATDMHDMPGREPRMKDAYEHIASIVGDSAAEQIFRNSEEIIGA